MSNNKISADVLNKNLHDLHGIVERILSEYKLKNQIMESGRTTCIDCKKTIAVMNGGNVKK